MGARPDKIPSPGGRHHQKFLRRNAHDPTAGFPAEFLILLAALQTHTGAGIAALSAMMIGTGCFMMLYQHAFFGPATNPVLVEAEDLRLRERLVVIALALVVLVVGFHPAIFLDIIESAGKAWIARLTL